MMLPAFAEHPSEVKQLSHRVRMLVERNRGTILSFGQWGKGRDLSAQDKAAAAA